jgi:hypothetical protein
MYFIYAFDSARCHDHSWKAEINGFLAGFERYTCFTICESLFCRFPLGRRDIDNASCTL